MLIKFCKSLKKNLSAENLTHSTVELVFLQESINTGNNLKEQALPFLSKYAHSVVSIMTGHELDE